MDKAAELRIHLDSSSSMSHVTGHSGNQHLEMLINEMFLRFSRGGCKLSFDLVVSMM